MCWCAAHNQTRVSFLTFETTRWHFVQHSAGSIHRPATNECEEKERLNANHREDFFS